MVDKPILFIFGAPRSGTTYVNALVRRFFDYGLCAEGQWVIPMSRRAPRYGDLSQEGNLRRLIEDVRKDYMFEHFRKAYSEFCGWDVDVTAEDVAANLPTRSYPGIVYAVFACVAMQMKKRNVGNKSPDYALYLPELLRWFPRARFLHVIRDGRDVALSTMRADWGEKSAYSCARHWICVQKSAEEFQRTAPVSHYCAIYYEKLLALPEETAITMQDFLQEPLGASEMNAFVDEVQRNGKQENVGRWQRDMSRRALRVYEAMAGQWLRRHGYETTRDDGRVSWLEQAAYVGQEVGRKTKRTLASWCAGAWPNRP